MNSRWRSLTLFVVVFAPGLLHAQTAPSGYAPPAVPISYSSTNNDKMYEDIEILRRILDRKLTSLYPSVPSKGVRMNPSSSGTSTPAASPGTLYFTPYFTPDSKIVMNERLDGAHQDAEWIDIGSPYRPYPAPIPFSSLEGVYIKGQGVLYTVTLSSLQVPAKAEADSTVNQLLRAVVVPQDTEWDGIRRQVRNEKEEPKKPEASKPPSLSDLLLRVLAENGHHFSQLGENESLAIVLTVHEANPSSSAAKSGTGFAKAAPKSENYRVAPNVGIWQRDIELLGELHLKQGKYDEAIEVFHKELEQTQSPKRQAELLRKLAQCHLLQGQDEKARNELDKAIILMKKGTEAKDKPAADVKPAALPVKLIISAPKKLLDQVKEGKISFEEFRRQASVETLQFGDRR